MNADQERRVKFEAETNYNKGFRLTRLDCMRSAVRGGQLTPTTETQRHGEEGPDLEFVICDLRIVICDFIKSTIANQKSPIAIIG
jgi:hypothetical protein